MKLILTVKGEPPFQCFRKIDGITCFFKSEVFMEDFFRLEDILQNKRVKIKLTLKWTKLKVIISLI